MLLELAKQYPDLIQEIEVERFRVVGASYELRAIVRLRDKSAVFVKDYLFLDGTRKYAYHWQSETGQLICRWDNAPHWREIRSFPHHCHREHENQVEASEVSTLEGVLQAIRSQRQEQRAKEEG